MSIISLLAVLIGIAIGAVLGFLFARSRDASAATGLAARASAAEERAHAASERAALVEGQLAERFESLSAQALDNFIDMGGERLAHALPLFVPHPRVAHHARARGAKEVLETGGGDEQMLERLVAYFHKRH